MTPCARLSGSRRGEFDLDAMSDGGCAPPCIKTALRSARWTTPLYTPRGDARTAQRGRRGALGAAAGSVVTWQVSLLVQGLAKAQSYSIEDARAPGGFAANLRSVAADSNFPAGLPASLRGGGPRWWLFPRPRRSWVRASITSGGRG